MNRHRFSHTLIGSLLWIILILFATTIVSIVIVIGEKSGKLRRDFGD